MKTYIVLIPLENNRDCRQQCEAIENYKFNIDKFPCDTVSANHVRGKVIELIGESDYDITNIEVEPISDFMDRCNNQEFDIDKYFMSYVYI